MSDEQEQQNETTDVAPVGSQFNFITDVKKHNLSKMLKKLDGSVDEALALLNSVMKNEEVDMKLRVECAKEILNKKLSVSTEINKEMLSRTIAESRLVLAQNSLARTQHIKNVEGAEEESSTPMFIPNMILDYSKVKEM